MCAQRLAAGDTAPAFDTTDWQGRPVRLADFAGQPVLLSFFRYASCPLCNLRISQMIAAHGDLARRGLAVIAVFQSPADKIAAHVGRQAPPFALVPDPGMVFYRRYRVETSWRGLLNSFTIGIGGMMRAVVANGFMPGSMQGPLNRIPADFLIGPDGRLIDAFYGSDIGDHVSLTRIVDRLGAGHEDAARAMAKPGSKTA